MRKKGGNVPRICYNRVEPEGAVRPEVRTETEKGCRTMVYQCPQSKVMSVSVLFSPPFSRKTVFSDLTGAVSSCAG